MNKWVKKIWHIYTMEYYSVIKKNEIMLLSREWIEMEFMMLSKISQTQKDKYDMFCLIYKI
jgi:hypothetical protein